MTTSEAMDLESFKRLDAQRRAERPKPFLLVPPDPLATEGDLLEVERKLGTVLPASYRQFLATFGGGSYGLTNISSADPSSSFFLPLRQAEAAAYLPPGLLVASDDGAGGLYVWQVKDGKAEEPLQYWNPDGGLSLTRFENILSFLAAYAYAAA